MKTSILKYIPFFIFIAFLTNCTVKDITVDPATGEKKSLIMISPDYLKTTIQVRLRDVDTKAFLKNEMVVKVYSNKKVIDFGGHYKNEFTVKNGILNFAIDPNEDISTASPLSLRVESSVPGKLSTNSVYLPAISTLTMTRPSSKVLLLQHNKLVVNAPQAFSGIKPLSFSSSPAYLSVNGTKINQYNIDAPLYGGIYISNPDSYSYLYIDPFGFLYSISNPSSVNFKVNYYPEVDKNLTDYIATFHINNSDNKSNIYKVYSSGKTILTDVNNNITESKIQSFDGNIKVPNMRYLDYLDIKVYTNDIGTCPSGLSFIFDGLDTYETQFEYVLKRKNINGESYITNIGIANPYFFYPYDITPRDITYSNLSNSVTFANNSQYFIEPQTMDLGGANSCGKNFTFKLTPRKDLTKYKIILKAGCSGKSLSITPNLSTLFKIAGVDIWEGVDFVAGSATLYLSPKGDYNFQGEYNNKNFSFNLSTDLANLEKMRTSTLAANTDIKNLTYTEGVTAEKNKMITINLTFSESSCPF